MGPSLLFDKSAIQSLGKDAISEVSRYFHTVVPPILLMETLADLSLKPGDLEGARAKVKTIAEKVFPIDSIANGDARSLCIHNLLGEEIPMTRQPAVLGARSVTSADGSEGVFIDIQPENEAVLRWRSGRFSEDDLRFAMEWRQNAKGFDLESMKRSVPKPDVRLTEPEQVRWFVDLMLKQSEFQDALLGSLLGTLACDSKTRDSVLLRWKWAVDRSLPVFAPYATHCLRVRLIYLLGMSHGVFGTRPTNILDLEYLYYTPFAFVFCSGDKLHRQLAPLVLSKDQTFVGSRDFQRALQEIAALRKSQPDVVPDEGSLIRELWIRHWKRPPRQPRRYSAEEMQRVMAEVRPILETLQKQEQRSGPRFPV